MPVSLSQASGLPSTSISISYMDASEASAKAISSVVLPINSFMKLQPAQTWLLSNKGWRTEPRYGTSPAVA